MQMPASYDAWKTTDPSDRGDSREAKREAERERYLDAVVAFEVDLVVRLQKVLDMPKATAERLASDLGDAAMEAWDDREADRDDTEDES